MEAKENILYPFFKNTIHFVDKSFSKTVWQNSMRLGFNFSKNEDFDCSDFDMWMKVP